MIFGSSCLCVLGYESSVERVFRGEMTSTVMCKECKTVSVVTESFLDLSLPVADEVRSLWFGGVPTPSFFCVLKPSALIVFIFSDLQKEERLSSEE